MRRPHAAPSASSGRHAAPERAGVGVLDAPTVQLAAEAPSPATVAASSYARFDVAAEQNELPHPVVTFAEVGEELRRAARRALPTTRNRVLAGVAAAVALLIGGIVIHANHVSQTTDSAGRPLSYSPESAVLNDCPGASAGTIGTAQYVGEANMGSEYGVPWTDDQGHTHDAWVLAASRTAPAKYDGTYSATNCTWINVN